LIFMVAGVSPEACVDHASEIQSGQMYSKQRNSDKN
jgi:hypothetical protein